MDMMLDVQVKAILSGADFGSFLQSA